MGAGAPKGGSDAQIQHEFNTMVRMDCLNLRAQTTVRCRAHLRLAPDTIL